MTHAQPPGAFDEAPETASTSTAGPVRDSISPQPGDPHYVVAATGMPVAVAEAPHRTVWSRIDRPFGFGFVVTLGVLAALVLGLAVTNLSTVLIYIVLALFVALGLDPAVGWLMRHGLPRVGAILIVFGALAVVVAGVLWLVIPVLVQQVAQFVRDIPRLIAEMEQTDWFKWLLAQFGDGLDTLVDQITAFLSNPSNIAAIGGGALQFGVGVVSIVSGSLITLVLTLYFLGSLPAMKQAFYRLTPARSRPHLAAITEEVTESIGAYLTGMVVLAACNAVFTFVIHLVLGLPFPALMAVVALCITFIPLIGSVLFWVVASVLALFTSPVTAIIFAVAYLLYMQIEAYVLTPRVMNRAVSIPGALVVIGALVGGTLLGLVGALVAIPVTASLLLIVKNVWVPKQDAKV